MANKMERFTQRALEVMMIAQESAERMQHSYVGTEHLLLGLLRERGGVASRVLQGLYVDHVKVEELVEQRTAATTRAEGSPLVLSPDTERVIELSIDESRRMKHHYVGTEHLLLGLVRLPRSTAIAILQEMEVSPDAIQRDTLRVLQESPIQQVPTEPTPISARPKVTAQEETKALFDKIEAGIHSKLLLRFLRALPQSLDAAQKGQVRRMIEEQFSGILAERSIFLSETERAHLLDPLTAPFRPADSNRRQLRFRITDKVTGALKADLSMSVTQARGLLPMFAEALKNGQTGKLLVMDDITERIEISIEDEQQADAGTA